MLTEAYHITKTSYSAVFHLQSCFPLYAPHLLKVFCQHRQILGAAVDSPIPFRSADGASEAEAGDVSASTPAESKYAPKSWDGFKWDGCLLKIRNYVYICVFWVILGLKFLTLVHSGGLGDKGINIYLPVTVRFISNTDKQQCRAALSTYQPWNENEWK